MAGLPKSYIKKYGITKKAWRMYRASKKKGKSTSKTRKSSKKSRGGNRKVARRGFNTAKIMSMMRMVSLVAPMATRMLESSTPEQKLNRTIADYTGYHLRDGTWSLNNLKRGWLPYLTTSLVTYGIPKLTGLIRKLI